METFKGFCDHDFVDFVINEFHTSHGQHLLSKSATKDQIIDTWRELQSNTPIYLTPIQPTERLGGDHSSYGEDGIRITGSWGFIASVLARLKELLNFENDQTKLRLVFRDVAASQGTAGSPGQSYVFYVNAEVKKPPKPKKPKMGL